MGNYPRIKIRLFSSGRMLLVLFLAALTCTISGCSRYPQWDDDSDDESLLAMGDRPKEFRTIILDAGHGGKDGGTQNLKMGLIEKRLALKTTKMTHMVLKRMGYKVVLVRDSDQFIELDDRVKKANKYPHSLFVSIHFNSSPSQEAHGIEVFFYNDPMNKNRSYSSSSLAGCVLKEMLKSSQATNRGVKEGAFRVIKSTKAPAILVEGGFLTNEGEAAKLSQNAYLQTLASAIAKGIAAYEKKTRHMKYLH